MKKPILVVLGLALMIYMLPYIVRGDLDRLNPFFEQKYVYAVAKGYGLPDHDYEGRYFYKLKGADESGKNMEYIVGVNTPNDFISKTYLRIDVRGKHVFSYDVVSEKDIPEKAKTVLSI
ncbi:YxeA family protein [Bacillus nitratireducens]|uniref:YxeA family protein n=1 Tax=Bacillus nitratireducens TaxID=2026193 RepID=UPI0039BF26E3